MNKVIADQNYVTQINRGGRPEPAPAVLSLTKDALNKDDPVTADIDNALLAYAGVFSGTPAEGLKKEVLIQTSSRSALIDRFMAEFSGGQGMKDFSPSGKEQALAIRLTGKFKTAFPDGKPKDTTPSPDKPGETPEKKEDPSADAAALKESKTDGMVLLVGDADMTADAFSVQVQDFFGQRVVIPRNGNFYLVQNIVSQLAGDSNLIAVRSRASVNRPFTVVKKMQAQAEDRWQSKIAELEKAQTEAQTRLNDLQKNKESGQRFILSPEQQAEIQKFQKEDARVKKELKEVRKSLRQDIDSLENRLKWLNIAGMPALVALSGISLAIIKRKKTAAQ